MPKLRDQIETKRFLRELAEAKRRYGRHHDAPTATIDCLPRPARRPIESDELAHERKD